MLLIAQSKENGFVKKIKEITNEYKIYKEIRRTEDAMV